MVSLIVYFFCKYPFFLKFYNNMTFDIIDLFLRYCNIFYRFVRLICGAGIMRNKWMPGGKVLSLCNKTVGTCNRKPCNLFYTLRFKLCAIRINLLPPGIMNAAACLLMWIRDIIWISQMPGWSCLFIEYHTPLVQFCLFGLFLSYWEKLYILKPCKGIKEEKV